MRQSTIPMVFVVLACIVAIGAYRGWFSISSRSPDAGSDKVNVNLTVDRDKMQANGELVKKRAAELTGKPTGGAKELDAPTNDSR